MFQRDKRFFTGDFSDFVLCFSESADSLSQWRGYADNAKGCCIGFLYEELKNYCLSTDGILRLEKVIYLDSKGISKVIDGIAKEILDNLQGLREWIIDNMTHDDNDPDTDGLLHYNFDGMLEYAFIDSLKYKSSAFNEENEWRMFFTRPTYKNPEWIAKSKDTDIMGPKGFAETILFLRKKIEFLITDDDLIPYYPIKFDEFKNNPISTIWVGPKSHIRQSDLELFLRLNGYSNTQIIESKITYC